MTASRASSRRPSKPRATGPHLDRQTPKPPGLAFLSLTLTVAGALLLALGSALGAFSAPTEAELAGRTTTSGNPWIDALPLGNDLPAGTQEGLAAQPTAPSMAAACCGAPIDPGDLPSGIDLQIRGEEVSTVCCDPIDPGDIPLGIELQVDPEGAV